MKKKLIPVLLLLNILSFTLFAQSTPDLRIQYKCMEHNINTNSNRAHFNIINDSTETILPGELTIRYHSVKQSAVQQFHCGWAQPGTSYINGSFVQIDDAEWLYTNFSNYPEVPELDFIDYSPSKVERGTSSTAVKEAIEWDSINTIY